MEPTVGWTKSLLRVVRCHILGDCSFKDNANQLFHIKEHILFNRKIRFLFQIQSFETHLVEEIDNSYQYLKSFKKSKTIHLQFLKVFRV